MDDEKGVSGTLTDQSLKRAVSRKSQSAGSAFERWWDEEGSGSPPGENEDHHEHVRRMCKVAWMNGAYIGQYGEPNDRDETRGNKR